MANRWAKFIVTQVQTRTKKAPTYDRDFHNASMNSKLLVPKTIRTLDDFSPEELAEIEARANAGIKVETGLGFIRVNKPA